jgi:hypothetical protein
LENKVLSIADFLKREGKNRTWIENTPDCLVKLVSLLKEENFMDNKFVISQAFDVSSEPSYKT